jgi:hypothetical protein
MTDSALNYYLASGTSAARAVFVPSPPTPASGPGMLYIWYETDTGDTYAYHGVTWSKVNTGGGGGGGAFATQAVGGLSTYTFTVPAGSKTIRFTGDVKSSSTAALSDILNVQFNGDATSDYFFARMFMGTGSGVGSGGSTSTTALPVDITSSHSGVNVDDTSIFTLEFPDYNGTTFWKRGVGRATCTNPSSGYYILDYGYGWANATPQAIASVTFSLSGGATFVAGSTISGFVS